MLRRRELCEALELAETTSEDELYETLQKLGVGREAYERIELCSGVSDPVGYFRTALCHLPGQHDQADHGRDGGGGRSADELRGRTTGTDGYDLKKAGNALRGRSPGELKMLVEDYEKRRATLTPFGQAMIDVANKKLGVEKAGSEKSGREDDVMAEKANDFDAHSFAQDHHIVRAMSAGGGKIQDAHDKAASAHEAAKNAATDQYGLPTKNPERFQRLSLKAREASKAAHALEKK
jgi:hypothetical protein